MNLRLLMSLALAGAALAHSARAQQSNEQSKINVEQLFATTCGWCHSDGGRVAGKGPQLMDTKRSDDFIRSRILNGKEGAMPAFAGVLSDQDIDRIIAYIHALKPHEG